MGKGVILGIDFSTDYTQLAVWEEEGNPQSISVGTSDNYLIPTVACYNRELNEWSAGEEAINKGLMEKSVVYQGLPLLFEDYNENAKEVLMTFMSYLLKVAVNYCNGKLMKNIIVTVEDVTPVVMEGITEIFEELGYDKDKIKVMSHSESFVYYVLNQNRDIWINSVYFLDLNRHGFKVRRLSVIKGRQPYVASVTVDDLSDKISMEMLQNEAQQADEMLAEYMEEKIKKHVVSGVYLSGEGFYVKNWEKTLETICRNRRVFKGNNLVVLGATYGAREFFYTPTLSRYLISCKGRTRVKVTMSVKHKGRDNFITLSNIGDYWYQACSKAECIMENPTEAVFEIHDIMNHTNETFKIDLTGFPKRPAKTTRLEVDFRYLDEKKFEIEINDLGFGEFFKSSGMSVKKEMSIR